VNNWPPIVWTFEPSVLVGVFATTVCYVWAWRRARLPKMPHPPGYGRLALFIGSMICILLALISPVDALATDFMTAHMFQHVLLLDGFPVLFILSLTKGILRPVTRRMTQVERKAGVLAHPVVGIILYVGMMGFWHWPKMYDLALEHPDIHVLEHVCFIVAGMVYWWHLLSPIRGRLHLGGMGPLLYMAVTKFFVGVLGIILAFSTHCFYPWYQTHEHYLGLSPRVDQNLAGVLMSLEQAMIMGVAMVYIVFRMLSESEKQAQRKERLEQDEVPMHPARRAAVEAARAARR
jgi:putative membrane protein